MLLPAAANAYLKDRLGADYGARLVGVKDMPKGKGLKPISLIGPVSIGWLGLLSLSTPGARGSSRQSFSNGKQHQHRPAAVLQSQHMP